MVYDLGSKFKSIRKQQGWQEVAHILEPIVYTEEPALILGIVAARLQAIVDSQLHQRQTNEGQKGSLCFSGSSIPQISISDYVLRLAKYCRCSSTCLVYAWIFMKRLSESGKLKINWSTIHRLLLTCVVVAAKFLEDSFYYNTHYAKVGGVPLTKLNQMERQLLILLDFNTCISEEEVLQETCALYYEWLQSARCCHNQRIQQQQYGVQVQYGAPPVVFTMAPQQMYLALTPPTPIVTTRLVTPDAYQIVS